MPERSLGAPQAAEEVRLEMRRIMVLLMVVMAVTTGEVVVPAWASGAASDATVTMFSVGLLPGATPTSTVLGPDGNVWFADSSNRAIGRITPEGEITEFGGLSYQPGRVLIGPDGEVWFNESARYIGTITSDGVVTEIPVPAGGELTRMALGPDGNFWIAGRSGPSEIIRVTPAGTSTAFTAGLPAGATPMWITAGPDGNMYFTAWGCDCIGRVGMDGTIDADFLRIPGSRPTAIVTGPDSALWFAEARAGRIGRVTVGGELSEYADGITPGSGPYDLAFGADGNVWFTEEVGAIGQLDVNSGAITEITAGLAPGSFPVGISRGAGRTLWFGGVSTGAIGRIALPDPTPPSTSSTSTTEAPTAGSAAVVPTFTG